MSNVLYGCEIAVALGLIIFVHELGHFAAAKAFGVWVRRFAIGFGPALVKWKRGETEYSLRAIPLGGFVEPMGEHPDTEGGDDPRALWRRPAWQRAVIFAAGVAMNGVLAVIFFTVASLVGLNAPSPVVGAATPLLPAERAGIKAGDRIVAIGVVDVVPLPSDETADVAPGKRTAAVDERPSEKVEPVKSFEDILTIISSRDAGTTFNVTVQRPGAEGADPERITFEGLKSVRREGYPAPRIGIEPALEPIIYSMVPGVPEEQAGLNVGDRILEVGGKPVHRFRQINEMLSDMPEGPVTLVIERQGNRQEMTVDPAKLKVIDLGMAPPVAIAGVDAAGPAAKAGIQPGDRVQKIEDVAWPTTGKLSETVKAAGDGGNVRLVLRRDDRIIEVTSGVTVYGNHEYPRLGVMMGPSLTPPLEVGEVAQDGPAAKAGIRPGDRVLTVGRDSTEPRTWDDIYAVFGKAQGKPVPLRVKRGGSELSTTYVAALQPIETFKLFGSKPGPVLYEPLPRIYNPLKAIKRGFNRTWLWLGRVYRNLLQLIKREVSTEAVGGPVMIVTASLGIAARGIGTFIDFWGILSVCIAVFNFLPVPPFDGGHVLFVIIEKIKGSPVGLKVRTWIWGAGWVAVGALFILITWQDIARLM